MRIQKPCGATKDLSMHAKKDSMRLVSILVVCAFLFAACADVDVIQEVFSDGTTSYSATIRLHDNLCAPTDELCLRRLQNPCLFAPRWMDCSFNQQTNVVTLEGERPLQSHEFTRDYSLITTRHNLWSLRAQQELTNALFRIGQDPAVVAQNPSFSSRLTVIMPAEVLQSDVGEIRGNEVHIDLISAPVSVHIISQEEHQRVLYGLVIFLAVFFVLVATVLIVHLVRKRKKLSIILDRTPSAQEQRNPDAISKAERQYRDYIQQHMNTFARRDIKNALVQAGLSDLLAEKYLNKYYQR